MILESPAWIEPDLAVLESFHDFSKSLGEILMARTGHRTGILCGIDMVGQRQLASDLKGNPGAAPRPTLTVLPEAADLMGPALADTLRQQRDATVKDPESSLCFVHDLSWAWGRYDLHAILAYLQRMVGLRRDLSLQTIHLYNPAVFPPPALWRLLRVHRAVWTGESACENFYHAPRPQPPPPPEFDFADDLRRNLDHLKRQTRIRAELVGNVVQAEALVEDRVRELQALNRLAQVLAHSQNLDEILQEALSRVIDLLDMDAGAIWVWLEDGPPRAPAVSIAGETVSDETLAAFHDALTAQAAPVQRLVWASDLDESPSPQLPASLGVRSFLTAPIKFGGDTVGLLEVAGADAHAFSLQEIHMVDVIGGQIGVAVENARLYRRHVQSETAERQLREQLVASERLTSFEQAMSRVADEIEAPLAAIIEIAAKAHASLPEEAGAALNEIRQHALRVRTGLADLHTTC